MMTLYLCSPLMIVVVNGNGTARPSIYLVVILEFIKYNEMFIIILEFIKYNEILIIILEFIKYEDEILIVNDFD
jgi:hypothetical protein